MRFMVFFVVSALAACSSQSKIGDDTYLVHASGKTTATRVGTIIERAQRQARELCLREGYTHMQVLDNQSRPAQFGHRAPDTVLEVKFFHDGGQDRQPCA